MGSTCGRRAGLVELARKKAGAVRLSTGWRQKLPGRDLQTRDLFEEPVHG